MTTTRTIGQANPRRARPFLHRAPLALAGALLIGPVLAQSPSLSAGPVRCVGANGYVSNCKGDATIRDQDDFSRFETTEPVVGDRADLDGRAKQIEAMNQQLRMERRRKDSLLHLYPDEAAHNAARAHELAAKDRSIRAAEERIDDLTRERRRIIEAAGFYADKPVPTDLKIQSQHVDIALLDARTTLRNCRDERSLVSKTYDDELGVLRKLWVAQRKG